jgi:hypothetical protein
MRIGGEGPRYDYLPVPVEDSSGPVEPAAGAQSSRLDAAASFAEALRGLGSAVDRGEAVIARATHGSLAGLDSAQLIALQAGIYRYSEAVDLVAKLVDRASSAVRTVVSPH